MNHILCLESYFVEHSRKKKKANKSDKFLGLFMTNSNGFGFHFNQLHYVSRRSFYLCFHGLALVFNVTIQNEQTQNDAQSFVTTAIYVLFQLNENSLGDTEKIGLWTKRLSPPLTIWFRIRLDVAHSVVSAEFEIKTVGKSGARETSPIEFRFSLFIFFFSYRRLSYLYECAYVYRVRVLCVASPFEIRVCD